MSEILTLSPIQEIFLSCLLTIYSGRRLVKSKTDINHHQYASVLRRLCLYFPLLTSVYGWNKLQLNIHSYKRYQI